MLNLDAIEERAKRDGDSTLAGLVNRVLELEAMVNRVHDVVNQARPFFDNEHQIIADVRKALRGTR